MNRITIDALICNGKPVVTGTRITVQTILEFLAAGDTIEDLLAAYPSLTAEDVLACIAFSSRMMSHHYSLLDVA